MRIHVITPETSACCWLNTYGRVISSPQNEDDLLTIFSTQEMPVRYAYGPFDDTATVCHCEFERQGLVRPSLRHIVWYAVPIERLAQIDALPPACLVSKADMYKPFFTDVRDTTQIVPTLTEKFNAEVLKAVTQFAFTWAPALVVCYHSLGGDGLYDIVAAEKSLYGGWRLGCEQTARERWAAKSATLDDIHRASKQLNWLLGSHISALAVNPEFGVLFADALGVPVPQLKVLLDIKEPTIPSNIQFVAGNRCIGVAKPQVRFDSNGGLYVWFDFEEVDGSPGINSVLGMSTQDTDSVPVLTPYFLHRIIEAPCRDSTEGSTQ